MTLSFSWEWQSAPDVRTVELSATWARLRIDFDRVIATLVEEREHSHGVRKTLDVPAYPLAEWLSTNWWNLNTSSHRPKQGGVNLAGAGSGFPWPDLTLQSDRDFMRTELRQRDRDPDFVRFLTQGRTVLDAEQCVGEIARFIDATVRRLEDAGIEGTLLQQEWTSIQHADVDEAAFCKVAAAWGFDPYDLSAEESSSILTAGQKVGDPELLMELASAIDFDSVAIAGEWLLKAAQNAVVGTSWIPPVEPLLPDRSGDSRPWRVGYQRARKMRQLLELMPTQRAPIENLVGVTGTSSDPPSNVVALVKITDKSAGIVLGGRTDEAARRFAGARALARKAEASPHRYSLLTRGSRYSDQVERAFAAEFLAPASGLEELLDGDFSEQSQRTVGTVLGVSPWVIEHQIENQLVA